jgi:hypothetical protein
MMRQVMWLAMVGVMTGVASAQKTRNGDLAEALLAERRGGEGDWAWRPEFAPTVPGDEATDAQVLKHWMGVWGEHYLGGGGYEDETTEVPARTRERLLKACLAEPEFIPPMLSYFPDTPATAKAIKEIFDRPPVGFEPYEMWGQRIKEWLVYHSDFYLEELKEKAEDLKFTRRGQLENAKARTALAKISWKTARPLLEQDGKADVYFAVGAVGLLYEHAAKEGDEKQAVALRERLMGWAADPKERRFVRGEAFEFLIQRDWKGRAAWFGKLVEDKSLDEVNVGEGLFLSHPIVIWGMQAPDDAAAVLTAALGNETLRERAIQFLLKIRQPATLKALLGCLTEPGKWPQELPEALVGELTYVEVAGSVPGILKWLEGVEQEHLVTGAMALARQHAAEAPAALRAAIPHARQMARAFALALLNEGRFTAAEVAETMAAAAIDEVKGEDATQAIWLGKALLFWVQERAGVAEALIERALALREKEPKAAAKLWQIVQFFPAVAVDREIVRRLEKESLDVELVRMAVERAGSMREAVPDGLKKLAGTGGERGAVAAAVLGDVEVCGKILGGEDLAAIRMLLAAARLGGTALPLATVGKIYSGKDAALAKAAERYLLATDSADARALVRGHYPGKYLILSNDEMFAPEKLPESGTEGPKELPALVKEMQGKDAPDEIFALYSSGGFGSDGQRVIRVRGKEGTLGWVSPDGKRETFTLTEKEVAGFLGYVKEERVDDLRRHDPMILDGVWYDYVHLTREGGRHIYINNPRDSEPHSAFVGRFRKLTEVRLPKRAKSMFE